MARTKGSRAGNFQKIFKCERVHTLRGQRGVFLTEKKGQQSSPVGRAGRKARRWMRGASTHEEQIRPSGAGLPRSFLNGSV